MPTPLNSLWKIFFRLVQLVFLSVDPIALHQETIRITPDQSTRLKAIFCRYRADELPYSEKKLLSAFIIEKSEFFSRLKVDQILRCLANFTSEKLLRENHGKGLADATKRMMEKDNGFALQAVISALIDMGNYASTDEVNAIPTDLRDFIDRWKNYSICKAAGLSLTGILHSTDQVDMNSLVEFVRNAELPNYLAIWLEFSKVEFDTSEELRDDCKGRPDLFLSNIEELATLKRYNMNKDPNSPLVDKLLFHVLNKLQIIYLDESTITNIVETVRMKFFDYYLKAATKDMLKLVMKTLNINKAESRLSFRAHTLLQSIKKGDLEIDIK